MREKGEWVRKDLDLVIVSFIKSRNGDGVCVSVALTWVATACWVR